MKVDLFGLSKQDLLDLKQDVITQIFLRDQEDKKTALDAAEKIAAKYGYSLDELVQIYSGNSSDSRSRNQKPKSKAEPKYRCLHDPKQTWSGRGRKPAWFEAALTQGSKPEDMLIVPLPANPTQEDTEQ